jgi:hypothetical protein
LKDILLKFVIRIPSDDEQNGEDATDVSTAPDGFKAAADETLRKSLSSCAGKVSAFVDESFPPSSSSLGYTKIHDETTFEEAIWQHRPITSC